METENNKDQEMSNINSSPPGNLSMRDFLRKSSQNAPPDIKVNIQEHKD